MAPVFLAVVEDLDDIGMLQLHPGLGFLVEAIDGVAVGNEAVSQDLDGDGQTRVLLDTTIDPREGSLGKVEEDLAPAIEEPRGVFLLETVELPAREESLSEKRSRDGGEGGIVGIGDGFAGLLSIHKPEHDGVVREGLGFEIGHGG
ncbi:MAG: hypothetical protein NVSMB9_23420 [Isosphaeraceae bacterium]